MRIAVVLTVAALSFGIARVARGIAKDQRQQDALELPYAPSPAAAPFLSLGYREAVADLLYVRLRGYFGDTQNVAPAIAGLCEAIIELDPRFQRVYEYCAHAMTLAKQGADQQILLRAIALLERGMREFPQDWRLPNLAGQIYTQDLITDDPKQQREWDEKGTLLVESAIRKPGAPAQLQEWAAVMRSKFGQHERAVQGLREMLLLATDVRARRALLERLAQLEEESADEIAGELYEARRQFATRWLAERRMVPPTWYVILGPRIEPGFDMASLATGGRDLITLERSEKPPALDGD